MKTKKDLTPGVKYRGYGYVNEFGEFSFEPEETGSRAGQMKIVLSKDDYTIIESKKYVLVRLKIDKGDCAMDRLKTLIKNFNELITVFKEYEF